MIIYIDLNFPFIHFRQDKKYKNLSNKISDLSDTIVELIQTQEQENIERSQNMKTIVEAFEQIKLNNDKLSAALVKIQESAGKFQATIDDLKVQVEHLSTTTPEQDEVLAKLDQVSTDLNNVVPNSTPEVLPEVVTVVEQPVVS